MPDKIFTNNQVSISGTVVSKFEFSHEVYGEGFYVVDLLVPRLSDTYDTIPLMISERLIDVTKQSFFEGIKFAKEGYHLNDISKAIQKYAESNGFSVVRDLVGHGIGTHMHEDPQIPNFKQIGRGIRLKAGMTLAIEPMINEGVYDVWFLDDDWTVVTQDGKNSAHYENTVLITEGEPELLSVRTGTTVEQEMNRR